ncbi:MAG TPA: hypothetical protein VF600_02585 [Abditibacteriaceae bacterium]
MLELYSRGYGAGDAEQMVLVQDGVVVAQWLVATCLAYHAGNGNPEMIGQSMTVFQERGFRKVEEWHSDWSADEFEDFLNELYQAQVLGQSQMLKERSF